jgi:hypothetical protein
LKEPLKIEFQRRTLPYTLLGSIITLCLPFLRSVVTVGSVGALLCIVREHYSALMPLFGERYLFWAKNWFVEKNEENISSISEGSWIRILVQAMILGKIPN